MAKRTQRDILDEKALEMSASIVKEAKVTFDGKQCTIKIPSRIAKFLEITKGDKVRFTLNTNPNSQELPKKTDLKIELIENGRR